MAAAAADEITVTLQLLTNEKFEVQVPRKCKVETLKREVFQSLGFRNKVKLLMNKKELEDDMRLPGCKITDGAEIQMLLVPPADIEVTVNVWKKGSVSVTVGDNNTIKDIRDELKDLRHCLGSAPDVYDFYDGSRKLKDDNDTPLHLFGISADYDLDLKCPEAKFKVFATRAEKFSLMKVMEVRGIDTVRELTERFLKYLETTNDPSSSDEIVLFHRPACTTVFNELDCEEKTMNDYGIQRFDRIMYINYRGCFKCACILFNGKSTRIYNVSRGEDQVNLITLQLKIQNQLGIPVNMQDITIPGLEDPKFPDKIVDINKVEVTALDI